MANPPDPKKRDQQFGHIGNLRQLFATQGLPTISVDTKKKELIGNFKNNGQAWQQKPTEVCDHDFPTDAVGKAVPYGIYDTQKKQVPSLSGIVPIHHFLPLSVLKNGG